MEQLESKFPFDGLGPAYYYKTIKDLKSMRVPIAHPDVPESLDKVENDLEASDIESYQKKMGYELLHLIKYMLDFCILYIHMITCSCIAKLSLRLLCYLCAYALCCLFYKKTI